MRAAHKKRRKRGTVEEHNLRNNHYSKNQIKVLRAIINHNFYTGPKKSPEKVLANHTHTKGTILNLCHLHLLPIPTTTLMDLHPLCPSSLTILQLVCPLIP